MKQKVFVDAMVLAPSRMSGIGHLTMNIINSLLDDDKFKVNYDLVLVVPFNKVRAVEEKFSSRRVKIKKIWLLPRMVEILSRLNLLPPMDIFIGKGLYIFPNFKNWPLLSSKSYTYIHDLSFIKYPEFTQPKNREYLQRYVPKWIKRSSYILTISQFSKNQIEETFKVLPKKITVVYAGIDTKLFSPVETQEAADVKKKYGIRANQYILYVGNIEPRKNLKRLIEAFNLLPDDLKQKYALVLIGGDGWLNEDILGAISSATQNGCNVIMPKRYVEDIDLPAIYSGARALVHPAIYEGFGIPPIEAMACDTPTAVSNQEPLKEVTNGASLLFDPFQTTSIKDAIIKIVSDDQLRTSLIEKGRVRSKELDLSKIGRTLTGLINSNAKGE